MSFTTTQAKTFYAEFYAYLQVHGTNLPAHKWLNCESIIALEAAVLDQGRSTLEEAQNSIHYYLNLIGI